MKNTILIISALAAIGVVVGFGAFSFFDTETCEMQPVEFPDGTTFESLEELQNGFEEAGEDFDEATQGIEFEVIDGTLHYSPERCEVEHINE